MDERPSRVGAREIGLVSRRTVNLGAAWSVPVVLAAVAAPAAQGSTTEQPPGDGPTATFGTATADKGEAVGTNRQVTFTLLFTNVVGDNTVQITDISKGGPWTSLPTEVVTITAADPNARFTLLRPDNNASLLGTKVSFLLNSQPDSTTIDITNTTV